MLYKYTHYCIIHNKDDKPVYHTIILFADNEQTIDNIINDTIKFPDGQLVPCYIKKHRIYSFFANLFNKVPKKPIIISHTISNALY